MTARDRDLVSIQEARDLVARAAEAQKKFATFTQEQVDAVVDACAEAATAAGEQLARMAVEETGYGNVPDKIIKNRLGSVDVYNAIRRMKTVGVLNEDREKGIIEVATPVGVVAAVIPCTNPTSTAIYKTLISLKAGNAIVHSPHPSAMRCICGTVDLLNRAALRAGAPEGLIGCLYHPTLQGTQEMMKLREVGVILATGGTGLVRAAYSSGKPAYGVGPGNVPACIERTADVRKAVADVIAGKTFDYGTICSSEQSIVTEDSIRDQVIEECRRQGAYFLSPEEAQRLAALVIDPVRRVPNNQIVGRPATMIAEFAGLKVPRETRVLIARLESNQVGREFPLSAEKLSPILAFYSVPNFVAAIDLCKRLLQFGGLGHTVSLHTQNPGAAREFGQAVPAFRVCVNTASVHGSIGYSTNLFPAMTLGCGAAGGNITSDNINPMHLLNVKRIAWESRPVEHRTISADQRLGGSAPAPANAEAVTVGGRSFSSDKPEQQKREGASAPEAGVPAVSAAPAVLDRNLIAKVVHRVLEQHGIQRGGEHHSHGPGGSCGCEHHAKAAASAAATAPSPSEVAAQIASRVFGAPAVAAAPVAPGFSPTVGGRSFSSDKSETQKGEGASAPEVTVTPFVSETEVRVAIRKGEKIFIGPKTIVTPAARDLGVAHDILVDTQSSSTRSA